MPSSNKRRRENYRKKVEKKKAEEKRKQSEDASALIAVLPKGTIVKAPLKADQVGGKQDHGGHQKALNFPQEKWQVKLCLNQLEGSTNHSDVMSGNVTADGAELLDSIPPWYKFKIGTTTIGFVYNGEWKAKSVKAGNGKRKMCLVSEQNIDFLKVVRDQLSEHVSPSLKALIEQSLRVNILCGASTISHTDAFRGYTPNFFYLPDQPNKNYGALVYDVYPVFKSSVVSINGKYFIPQGVSEASNELKCIGLHPKSKKITYFIFPWTHIDACDPVGNLSFGVVGFKTTSNSLQVIHKDKPAKLFESPLKFDEVTWETVLSDALDPKNRVLERPRNRQKILSDRNAWHKFNAWQYRHWWSEDPALIRIHAFFRTVRQVPTSSNLYRDPKKINYIDGKTKPGEYLEFKKEASLWEDICTEE